MVWEKGYGEHPGNSGCQALKTLNPDVGFKVEGFGFRGFRVLGRLGDLGEFSGF